MSAPLDHVARGLHRVCVPPNGEPQLVCDFWPHCQCHEDCIDRRDARMVRRILVIFISAVLAIAAGLIFWGLRA